MTLNSFFQRHAWLGFWFHVVFFPPPCTMSPHYSLNVSLSSLVHLAYLRDGHEDAREGAASSLHASLNTSPVAKTHAHTAIICIPSCPHLIPDPSDLLCKCKTPEDV